VVGSVKIDTEGHESAVLWGGHEMIRQCRPQMLVEATAQSLAPHCGWLGELGYMAVMLGERRHGERQRVWILAMPEVEGYFKEGMILLLPPGARDLPAWSRLKGPELEFA